MANIDNPVSNQTELKTNPGASSPVYSKRPNLFKNIGVARTYIPYDNTFKEASKPPIKHYNYVDRAYKNEPVIRQGLSFIALAVLQRLNGYEHEDPLIETFINKVLMPKLPNILNKLILSLLKYGSSTAEIIYEWRVAKGSAIPQVILEDLILYHPLSVDIQLNNYRKLTHGEKVIDSIYKSGIWVPLPTFIQTGRKSFQGAEIVGSKIRLPEYKVFHMHNTIEGDNPFGTSLLESILPFHLYKEAFINMMWVALDRYGTPLVYALVPNIQTGRTKLGADGNLEPITLVDEVKDTLDNISSKSGIVISQNSRDQPVEVGTLTTGNNFSDSFISAIEFCDENMIMGLGIPNLLFRDKSSRLGSGQAGEVQLDVFNSFIDSLYTLVMERVLDQVVGNLIDINFSRDLHPLGENRGVFTKKPPRFSDLKVMISAIESLENLGYINYKNDIDFDWVRDLISAPKRDIKPEERSFKEEELLVKMKIAMQKAREQEQVNVEE